MGAFDPLASPLEVVANSGSVPTCLACVGSADQQSDFRLQDFACASRIGWCVRHQRGYAPDRIIGGRNRLERGCSAGIAGKEQRIQIQFDPWFIMGDLAYPVLVIAGYIRSVWYGISFSKLLFCVALYDLHHLDL